jgi:hypothetical protein
MFRRYNLASDSVQENIGQRPKQCDTPVETWRRGDVETGRNEDLAAMWRIVEQKALWAVYR